MSEQQNFKVGDVVEGVMENSTVQVGAVYVVREVDPTDGMVKVQEQGTGPLTGWMVPSRFRLLVTTDLLRTLVSECPDTEAALRDRFAARMPRKLTWPDLPVGTFFFFTQQRAEGKSAGTYCVTTGGPDDCYARGYLWVTDHTPVRRFDRQSEAITLGREVADASQEVPTR